MAHRLLQQELQVQVHAMMMTRERCLLALSSSSASSIRGSVPGRQPGLAGWMSFEFLFVFHP